MKVKPIKFVILIVFILISSCQSGDVETASTLEATDSSVDGNTAETVGSSVYPGPESNSGSEMGTSQDIPAVLYPAFQDQEEVPWDQAIAMIMNVEPGKILQSDDLKVILLLKDGRTLITREPHKDDIRAVLEQCGEKCAGIELGTE